MLPWCDLWRMPARLQTACPVPWGFDLDRPLREARDGFEKAYFEFHLAREGGSMTRVAEKPDWSAPTCIASCASWVLIWDAVAAAEKYFCQAALV